MNTLKIKIAILTACLLLGGRGLSAQSAHNNPILENFFPPDLLMQFGETIGVTEDQKSYYQELLQKTQEHTSDLQQQMKKEVEELASLTKSNQLNEAAVLAQSDKVMNIERELRRTHLTLLVRLKNKLTPEQQARLTELKNQAKQTSEQNAKPGESEGPTKSFQTKMHRVHELVQQAQADGRDLSSLQPLKEELEPLVQEKKLKEAEAVLDRALKILETKESK